MILCTHAFDVFWTHIYRSNRIKRLTSDHVQNMLVERSLWLLHMREYLVSPHHQKFQNQPLPPPLSRSSDVSRTSGGLPHSGRPTSVGRPTAKSSPDVRRLSDVRHSGAYK